MEGTANANLWRELSVILSPSFTDFLLFPLEPSATVWAEPVSNQIPKSTDTRDAAAEKACGERYGNHQTLDYASAEQDSSQGQDGAEHIDPEINDKTLNYLSALGDGCPNTHGSNSEANGDNHQTLHFLQKQPASCYRPNIASASLEINVNKHQTQPARYDRPNVADTSLERHVNNHQTFDYLSAQPGSSENPKAAYSNQKRKSPEDTVDLRLRKRITDRAYRHRCKEDKNNTKAENGRLKAEIDRLNEECVGKNHILLDHKEEIQKLRQNVKRLEDNLHTQTTVVEVLSKQLASVKNIHLELENTHLKSQIDILRASISSPNDSIIRQFQERNDQLQREKSMLRMIVEALCQKINNTREEAKVANPSATKDHEIFRYIS